MVNVDDWKTRRERVTMESLVLRCVCLEDERNVYFSQKQEMVARLNWERDNRLKLEQKIAELEREVKRLDHLLAAQQLEKRLTGASEGEPVSSKDLIQAGEVPPFIQSGMIVRHRDGGPALRVEHIEDLTNPTAACRSGVGKAVRVPCAEMRADYRLVESFKP